MGSGGAVTPLGTVTSPFAREMLGPRSRELLQRPRGKLRLQQSRRTCHAWTSEARKGRHANIQLIEQCISMLFARSAV